MFAWLKEPLTLLCLLIISWTAFLTIFLSLLFIGNFDTLKPVNNFNYTNHLIIKDKKIDIVCKWRGSRSDFREDGTDIKAGDRIVRDCKAYAAR